MYIFKKTNGFTLIELLVVIAIIGILSSVVLASLNKARDKARNASVMASLANMRSQAEMYYSGTYIGVCADPVKGIAVMLAQATSTGNGPSGVPLSNYCQDSVSAWSAAVKLKGPGYWCSGSSGVSKATSSIVGWSATSCQ